MQIPFPLPRVSGFPAHGGVEGPVWSAWNFDPIVLIPAALVAMGYWRGLGRWLERSHAHPWWRTALFYFGLAVIVLAIESPIDRLGEHHFTFHVLQHELFIMMGAPLMLLGAPTTPLLRGTPRWLRAEILHPLIHDRSLRETYRLLTLPGVGLAALLALFWAWHLMPGWYEAALRNDLVHDVQHASFIAAGVLFWWSVIDPWPLRSRLAYPLRIFYLLVAAVGKTSLGVLLAFTGEPLYPEYANARPIIGLSLIDDQRLGGLLMFSPSSMVFVAAVVAIVVLLLQKLERDQLAYEGRLASRVLPDEAHSATETKS